MLAAEIVDTTALANRLRPVLLKLNRELRREIHSLGVTGGQVGLLVQIKYRPGIGMRELASLERMSVPGMSKFVARLEHAGLVQRAPVEGDQRRVGLSLTAAGHKVLRSGARTFLSVRKHRNYRLFFTGQVISNIGTWMQRVAQSWLILSLTHSPVAVGILALCQFMPFTLFSLFAGVVVDRLDARRTVLVTQAVHMSLASIIAGITLAGIVEPWHVYAIALLMGCVQVLDAPSRQQL